MLDALTYAGNRESLKPVEQQVEFVARRHLRRAARRPARRRVRHGRALRRRVARGQLAARARAVHPARNVIGTYTILEAVREHGMRLHHISTDEVFGDLDLDGDDQFTEETPYDPSSPYSATKAGSDLLVRAWARSFGIHATICRTARTTTGPTSTSRSSSRGCPNALLGDGCRSTATGSTCASGPTSTTHNEASHLILSKGAPGETYLIGGRRRAPNLEILRRSSSARASADADRPRPGPPRPRPALLQRLEEDPQRSAGRRRCDFRAGLEATIDWYRDNDWWWEPAEGRHRGALRAARALGARARRRPGASSSKPWARSLSQSSGRPGADRG